MNRLYKTYNNILTNEEIYKTAFKYNDLLSFKDNDRIIYDIAINRNLLSDISSFIPNNIGKGIISYIKISNDNSCYYKLGLSNKSTLDMIKDYNIPLEYTITILKEYNYTFYDVANKLYQKLLKAHKNNIINVKDDIYNIDVLKLDTNAKHLKPIVRSFNISNNNTIDKCIIYYLKIESSTLKVYNLAFTTKSLNDRILDLQLSDEYKVTILYQEVYNDINKAKLIESKLHKKFQMKKINGLHILNSGNSKLYSSDILNMDKEICSAAA